MEEDVGQMSLTGEQQVRGTRMIGIGGKKWAREDNVAMDARCFSAQTGGARTMCQCIGRTKKTKRGMRHGRGATGEGGGTRMRGGSG